MSDPTTINPGVNSDITDLSAARYIGSTGQSITVRGPLVDASGNPIGGSTTANLTGATPSLDWNNPGGSTLTLSANATVSFANAANGRSVSLAITNTAANYTVTWPAAVKWSGGVVPVQTTGTHTDVYTFLQIGGVIYGTAVQNF